MMFFAAHWLRRSLLAAVVSVSVGLPISLGSTPENTTQQTPPRVRVRVVDGTTSQPVAGVAIYVRCLDNYPRSTRFTDQLNGVTDAQGEVAFGLREPAVCIPLGVRKDGFSPESIDFTRPHRVLSGETTVMTRLWRHGSIDGRLLDERARPLADEPVRLAYFDEHADSWRPSGLPVVTDAEGRFRIDRLPANRYAIEPEGVERLGPELVVGLQPGEARQIELRGRRVSTFTVSGVSVDETGQPRAATVSLERGDSPAGYPWSLQAVRTAADGRFSFSRVPRGSYRLRVYQGWPQPIGQLEALAREATTSFDVERDITGVTVTVIPSRDVSGTIQFSGRAATEGRILLNFVAVDGPAGGQTAGGQVAVGTGDLFTTSGLRPGRYVVGLALAPFGWRIESAMTGGRDVASEPLTIGPDTGPIRDLIVTFTDRRTDLSGIVRRASGTADGEGIVVAFSVNRAHWLNNSLSRRVRPSLTDQNGRYHFADLATGEYFVAVVAPDDYRRYPMQPTPVLLDSLIARAERITLEYDTPMSVNLVRP